MGHQSPHAPAPRPLTAAVRPLSPDAAGLETTEQNSDRMLSMAGLLIRSEDEHPIELPADVPEDALRQAPVSVKNRLSMTLGLRAKDTASHRISSVYYPQALSNLLKSPGISSLLLTPEAGVKGPPVQTLVSPIMSDGEAGFLLANEDNLSIGLVIPESKTGHISAKQPPTVTQTSNRASIVGGSAQITRSSSLRSPAFTSHPAVMSMVIAPTELPAATPRTTQDAVPGSRPLSSSSRKASQSQHSSLGEPGPELAEEGTTRSASVSEPRILVETAVVTVAVVPASAEEETFAAAERKAEKANEIKAQEEIFEAEGEIPIRAILASEPPQLPGDEPATLILEQLPQEENDKQESDDEVIQVSLAPSEATLDPPIQANPPSNSSMEFVAELEAIVPKPLVPKRFEGYGPVELEAPQHTFKLPPRAPAAVKNPVKEVSKITNSHQGDFFKLPSEQSIKPGFKPADFGGSKSAEPIQPLRMKLTNKDGQLVPVSVQKGMLKGRSASAVRNSQLKIKVDSVANVLDKISYTPDGSPIHGRSASSVSSNSAQLWSHRSTRSLGPPEQAPAPSAPGGRMMIERDFATAGQFDGERKDKKKQKKESRSSAGSKSGWKTFFRSSSAHNSSIGVPESVAESSNTGNAGPASAIETGAGAGSDGVTSPVVDMMTMSGKDVLWFRDGGKKSVGVPSA